MNDILLTQGPGELDEGLAFDPHQYLRLVAERWRLIAVAGLLTTLTAVALFFMTPEKYKATTVIQIEQRSPLGVTSDRNPWLETWATVKYYPTQYRLLKSRGLAERVVRALNLVDEPAFNPARANQMAVEPSATGDDIATANLARRLLGGLDVDPVKDTELARITYVGTDPDLAARIANQIVMSYVDWEIDKRSQNVGRTSKFLEDEIESLKLELEDKEQRLNEHGKNSDIVTLDPSTNLTLQRLQNLNSELTSAARERVEKEAQYVELSSTPKERIANQESAGLIGEMKRGLIVEQRAYENKSLVYKANHPDMIALASEIDERLRALQQEIDNHFAKAEQRAQAEFRSAQRREASLSQEIHKVKGEARDLSQLSVEYNNLQMEINAGRILQDDLLRQLSKSDLNARMSGERETNIRVIDTA
ncbi:MAG: GumC family protein, partial [Acidobacteriota bacterium]|nr:GumC family protein [Acidobacteriota bacterium]